jgi:hypothetical protein
MSFSSKAKKVKPKGIVRELKLVHSTNRRGSDIIKTEEVKTPKKSSKNASSSNQRNQSSSPTKRSKMDVSDMEPISFHLEGLESDMKRSTLVFLFPSGYQNCLTVSRARATT